MNVCSCCLGSAETIKCLSATWTSGIRHCRRPGQSGMPFHNSGSSSKHFLGQLSALRWSVASLLPIPPDIDFIPHACGDNVLSSLLTNVWVLRCVFVRLCRWQNFLCLASRWGSIRGVSVREEEALLACLFDGLRWGERQGNASAFLDPEMRATEEVVRSNQALTRCHV